MALESPRELFVLMLTDVRQGSDKAAKIFEELSAIAEDPDIKQSLEARMFVSQKVTETLDQCFKVIGEKPVKLPATRSRIYDVLVEEFRKEVAEIKDTKTRRFFVLAKLNNLAHLRAAEYQTLIAAADMSGNYGVASLLETCLADKLALADRTRRWLRRLGEADMAESLATKRAA